MQNRLMFTSGSCPNCGARIWFYEEREWKYGSPIKACKECNGKYVDRRYHEIAVEGILPNSLDLKLSLKKLLIIAGVFASALLIHLYEIFFQNYYHIVFCGLMLISLLCIFVQIVDFVDIITGSKAKRFEKLRAESVQRLSDVNYAAELASVGYPVPNEFLPNQAVDVGNNNNFVNN